MTLSLNIGRPVLAGVEKPNPLTEEFRNGRKFGLTTLIDTPTADADIVFLHGLMGNAYQTWVHVDDERKVYWPMEFLPVDFPYARILAYQYDAHMGPKRKVSQDSVPGFATDLVNQLEKLRSDTNTVVDKQSAKIDGVPHYPIRADHRKMTKFSNREDAGYNMIVKEVRASLEVNPESRLELTDNEQAGFSAKRAIETGRTPGSGKSTLLKYLLTHFRCKQSRSNDIILSHFFSGSNVAIQRSLFGLIRSLLFQVLAYAPEELHKAFNDFQRRCKTSGSCGESWFWEEGELRDILQRAILSASQNYGVYIFIDALDECGDTPDIPVRVFRFLEELIKSALGDYTKLHICFSCRHYPLGDLVPGSCVCLDDFNGGDIERHIRHEFEGIFAEPKLTLVVNAFATRASGVFQWVDLVLPRIWRLKVEKIEKIQEMLDRIPQDLLALYLTLLQNVDDDDKEEMRQTLKWILFAKRILTVREMSFALGTQISGLDSCDQSAPIWKKRYDEEDGRELLRRLSGGLVEVVERVGHNTEKIMAVQFIHYSVFDFLRSPQGITILDPLGTARDIVLRTHLQLTSICVSCFRSDALVEWASGPETRQRKLPNSIPLLEYAVEYGFHHAGEADIYEPIFGRFVKMLDLPKTWVVHCYSWANRKMVAKMNPNVDGGDAIDGILHIAAKFNLRSVCLGLFNMAIEVDSKNWQGLSPMHMAVSAGHEEIVRLFLARPDVALESRNRAAQTPVISAAFSGRINILNLLLENGGNIDAKDEWQQTALIWATILEFDKMASFLIKAGADIHVIDKDGRNSLSYAVASDREQLVALFLNHGVDADIPDIHCETPLFHAVQHRSYKSVIRLLEHGVFADPRNDLGWTPLMLTAVAGASPAAIDIARLLVQQIRVDVNAMNRFGSTALNTAITKGCISMIQLLLGAPGIDVNFRDQTQRVDVNARDDMLLLPETPLMYAIRSGRPKMVEILLRHDGVKKNVIPPNSSLIDLAMQRSRIFMEPLKEPEKEVIQVLTACARVRKCTEKAENGEILRDSQGSSQIYEELVEAGWAFRIRKEHC
ncbi:hypothetical protein EJ06DRAFT_523687 [Trichodelitschia bisporula]|uniref:Nephrocystin 3-like N-terminal domain-containing protein n=1 Tax=Trichodelitschia bisporula TaxID=703511 RepID=A0A6G1HPD5_9PEZI|nr:hypothetical protein EJ06DRAFT_523687 [Trichodelitschia bisporula]